SGDSAVKQFLNPTLWQRLASMSAAELLDRARQDIAKRRDAMLYRLGRRFEGDAPLAATAAPAHFFFEPGELADLVALYRSRFPDEAKALLERAERICRHRFDLLGYEDVDYGPEIDWHLDAVNGRSAPRKPWHQIRLLDFEEVGDAKVTWELNRHQHFFTLALAECMTRDGRFAGELVRQWTSWRADNPYPIGINWASSLEVAFRAMSWLWARSLLEKCPHVSGEFRAEMLRALALGARHIETHFSTYSSPNTHLLGEAMGLFFIGTLCPELPRAEGWQRKSWRIILEHAEQKVLDDGFYFEQSTYYHVYALDFFLHARILAAVKGIAVPAEFDQTIRNMLELLCVLGCAGMPPRWGDDDGGRVFDGRRNRAEHLLDPLSTGAALFGRGDFKSVAGGLRAETLWLLGRRGAEKFDQIPAQAPERQSAYFRESGICVMAGSEAPGQQMAIDAGPLGGGTGGHSHADTLGLHLAVDGQECLGDAGTYRYVTASGDRNAFRGSAAHNVLLVDGKDHAELGGPFSWRSRPNVQVELWVAGESFDLLAAGHDGYARLPKPVRHLRSVFYLRNQFWLVRDIVLGSGAHDLEINWHLAPGMQPETTGANRFRAEASGRAAIVFLVPDGHGWQPSLETGWYSPAYGRKVQSPMLRFRQRAQLPAEFATMICVTGAGVEAPDSLVRMDAHASGVSGYEINTAQARHVLIFSECDGDWALGPWSSDAKVFYCRRTMSGALQQLAFVQGSFVKHNNQKVLFADRRATRCEACREAAGWRISCPAGETVKIAELPEKAN
ncbi:MAG: heparinase II/III family protein, partial [Acidobacteria bacterium]|nr:heparinase II/III family protein [Acidobacteriota bacterium]